MLHPKVGVWNNQMQKGRETVVCVLRKPNAFAQYSWKQQLNWLPLRLSPQYDVCTGWNSILDKLQCFLQSEQFLPLWCGESCRKAGEDLTPSVTGTGSPLMAPSVSQSVSVRPDTSVSISPLCMATCVSFCYIPCSHILLSVCLSVSPIHPVTTLSSVDFVDKTSDGKCTI